jgi:hypothetical protein
VVIILNQETGGDMWHVWETGEVYIGFWWRNLRERDHLEDLDVDGRMILKSIVKMWDENTWTGLNWFRIGTRGMR